jgi:hypothetical protein
MIKTYHAPIFKTDFFPPYCNVNTLARNHMHTDFCTHQTYAKTNYMPIDQLGLPSGCNRRTEMLEVSGRSEKTLLTLHEILISSLAERDYTGYRNFWIGV